GREAGVHGRDPVLVLRRSGEARRPEWVHAPGARHSSVGGRRVRRRARGRHHDDAGALQDARGGKDPGAPGRHNGGTVLMGRKNLSMVVAESAPKAIGPYSQAVVGDGTVETAGQSPLDASSGTIVSAAASQQAEPVL